MSDVVPEESTHVIRASDRRAYFEQRLFVLSPFGLAPTAVLIFVLLLTSLVAALAGADIPILTEVHGKAVIAPVALLGLYFCLLNTVVLAMQRYSRLKERQDTKAFALVLRGGLQSATELTELTPVGASLVFATIAGIALGLT